MTTRFFTILTVLAGITAGIGSSVLMSSGSNARHDGAGSAAASSAKDTAAAPASGAGTALALRRLEHRSHDLGQRLQDMEARLGQSAGEPDERTPEERMQDEEAAAELANEQIQQEMEARFSTHELAAVDQDWARAAQENLQRELAALGGSIDGAGAPDAIDCRSGSCLATVEFSSYAAALGGVSAYTTHFYEGINCAIAAAVEPPGDPQAPCPVKLLFHECS